jgi:hypothetical protein
MLDFMTWYGLSCSKKRSLSIKHYSIVSTANNLILASAGPQNGARTPFFQA